MRFEVINGVIEGVTPHERFVPWRVTTFEAYDGQIQLFGDGGHGGVEQGGERMGGIDDEAYVVCRAEFRHGVTIHASRNPCSMLTFDLLGITTGGIVVGATCLVEYFYRCSSFCCSSENENHDVLILDLTIVDLTPSRLRRTPSINRGRVGLLAGFGNGYQLLLCL